MRTASASSNAICPAMRRRLTSTATSAVATAPPHSRTRAVWKAVRSTSIVVSPYVRPIAATFSTCSLLRPNIFSVGIPRSMSAKKALIHRSSRNRCSVSCFARPPMSASSSTSTGPVTTRTTAESGSTTATTRTTRTGTRTARVRAGWKVTTQASIASRPAVRTLTSSPVRSPLANVGPRRCSRSVSASRSVARRELDARCPRTSAAQMKAARATARSEMATRNGATAARSAPPRKTRATVAASRNANGTTRTAATNPHAVAARRRARADGSSASSRAAAEGARRGIAITRPASARRGARSPPAADGTS